MEYGVHPVGYRLPAAAAARLKCPMDLPVPSCHRKGDVGRGLWVGRVWHPRQLRQSGCVLDEGGVGGPPYEENMGDFPPPNMVPCWALLGG